MIVRFRKPIYRAIYDEAWPYLQTRNNEIHTLVSYRFGLRLTRALGADPDIVTPAIVLHDVGWSAVPKEKLAEAYGPHMKDTAFRDLHEQKGAEIAGGILEKVGYPKPLIGRITLIVSRHDSGLAADSLEEAIVKDCDKLYRFTSISVDHDSKVFKLTRKEYLERITERIDRWFLTKKGAQLARAESKRSWRGINN